MIMPMIIPERLQFEYFAKSSKADIFNEQNTEKTWDPVSKVPTLENLKALNQKLKAQQIYIEENLESIKRKRRNTTILSVIGAAILIILLSIIVPGGFQGEFMIVLIILGILLISKLIKDHKIKKITKDIIKLELAQRNNYLYDPEESEQRFEDYRREFPEAFNRGTQSQNIEDVFWGKTKKNNHEYHFTSGIFNYKRREGSGNNRRIVSYKDHYIAIKPSKPIHTRFTLIPNNIILNLFSRRNIDTESKKFNDTYTVTYKGKKEDNELNITRILSPRAQEELIKLNEHSKQRKKTMTGIKRANGTTVIISERAILFYIPGPILENPKTKLTKNAQINEEDLHELNNELNTLIDISTELVKYIN